MINMSDLLTEQWWLLLSGRRYLLSLLFILILPACQNREFHEAENLISKVEHIGINHFQNLEFFIRGDYEHYSLCSQNDSGIHWSFYLKTDQFEISEASPIGLEYAQQTRKNIELVDVTMISQSPWCGAMVRFWISPDEIVVYLDPEFQFDSESKMRWNQELMEAVKLKPDWYLIAIDSDN